MILANKYGSFLPYTISFNTQTPQSESSSPRRLLLGHLSGSGLGLKPKLSSNDTPPHTPDTAGHPFGSQLDISSPDLHFVNPNHPRAASRNERHVPEWGCTRFFNQPRSKAMAAPPSTVLEYPQAQHQLLISESVKMRADATGIAPSQSSSGKTQIQTPSRDKSANQADWTVEPAIQGNSALSNALQAAVDRGHFVEGVLVFGTIGFPCDSLSSARRDEISDHLECDYGAHTVFVKDEDFDQHYIHYCKTILWPILNYQIPDHPKSKAYADHSWSYYVKVNEKFAKEIIRGYKHGDTVWIHDYHLLLVPGMIRKQIPDARIGFFLHTAFPSSEVFRCLAMRNQLLEGMLGANLIAFQAREYADHFLQTCSRILVVEATDLGVQLEKRFVNVTSCPIGIVPEELLKIRSEPGVSLWTTLLEEKYSGKQVIACRDQLDNIRGIKQKLLAYEIFLDTYPEWVNKTVLIQVAISTAGDDKNYDYEVSEIVTRINAKFSNLTYSPLVFLRQDIAYPQYLALLSVADVFMVTSLRDGLNLSCHEFIECQNGQGAGSKKHGPLILSEFTGSAEIFKGNELAVNPWNLRQMARSIRYALLMTPNEKKRRHAALAEIVKEYDGTLWLGKLSYRLEKAYEAHQQRDTYAIPRLPLNMLSTKYQITSRRLFILDYEGTLTNLEIPDKPNAITPRRVNETLTELLAASEDNIVYVSSASTMEELTSIFKQVPNLGLIAENGCFIRPFANCEWIDLSSDVSHYAQEWKDGILNQLDYYMERVEGSWYEERKCTITYHYENASDPEGAARQAGDMANHINDSCQTQRIKAVPLDKNVVIEPRDISKVTACQWILQNLEGSKDLLTGCKTAASSVTEDYFSGTPPQADTGMQSSPSLTSSGGQLEVGGCTSEGIDTMPKAFELPSTGFSDSAPRTDPERVVTSNVEHNSFTWHRPEFLLVAGDDRDDECVFGWANQLRDAHNAKENCGIPHVFTVCVSQKNTEAGYTLTQGATGTQTLLSKKHSHRAS